MPYAHNEIISSVSLSLQNNRQHFGGYVFNCCHIHLDMYIIGRKTKCSQCIGHSAGHTDLCDVAESLWHDRISIRYTSNVDDHRS